MIIIDMENTSIGALFRGGYVNSRMLISIWERVDALVLVLVSTTVFNSQKAKRFHVMRLVERPFDKYRHNSFCFSGEQKSQL